MRSVTKFISQNCPSDPEFVDRLIVSAFININKITISANEFLSDYLIRAEDSTYQILAEFIKTINAIKKQFEVEDLIELFEFVVSPEDKVVTGAVYTPASIREYIVKQTLYNIKKIDDVKICDPACGCSGFLYTAAKAIKERTGKGYAEIFRNNIFGLDIQKYSIIRSKLLLSLFVLKEELSPGPLEFNLYHGNALSFNWSENIKGFAGFQVILGNPPYVCSRNMDVDTLTLLKRWDVTSSGHPDLYIPFFQIGFEALAKNGILGFITVNTFIKSINGRALRNYFSENKVSLKIINFGGEQVFKDKNTYTCLCFLRKKEGSILYKRTHSGLLDHLTIDEFLEYAYADLNNYDGWNLVDSFDKNEFINKIESVGKHFKDLFTTRNGIATLKNDVYKFKPIGEDNNCYYMLKGDVVYPIEKGICRRIVNANKIKAKADLIKKEEKIIFPYELEGDKVIIIEERKFRKSYPLAYRYLKKQKQELDTRDKGKKKYEAWYAYGRRQSMEAYTYKLFFPHICERPTFVISKDADLLFYNGIAVVSDSLQTLIELKSLLESDIFFNYIKSTTKDYSSGYISLSRNYLKNFGIPELTDDERRLLKSNEIEPSIFWGNVYERAFNEVTAAIELV